MRRAQITRHILTDIVLFWYPVEGINTFLAGSYASDFAVCIKKMRQSKLDPSSLAEAAPL